MPVEILSQQRQIRFRVLTALGEYQDALYVHLDALITEDAIAAAAQERADAWVISVTNVVPAEIPLVEDLTAALDQLTVEQARLEEKIALVLAAQSDMEPPEAPTGLKAFSDAKGIQLTWNEPFKDDVTLAGYLVSRDEEVIAKATARYTDFAVVPKQTYLYAISAYDVAGNISERSEAVEATWTPEGTAALASDGQEELR